MNHLCRIALASLACTSISSTSLAQYTITVDASARYQGAPLQLDSQTSTNPPLVFGDVATANALSDPAMDGFSYARGEARFGHDFLGAYSRNYARASGWAPGYGPPDEVYATSNSTASVSYRVSSPTTPVGTAIRVLCLLNFTGTLGVANYFGSTNPGELTATFGSTFSIDGTSYFDASATMEQRFSNGQAPPIFTSTGPWGGSWTAATGLDPLLGDFNAMILAHSDVVNFNTVMAADFDVVFNQFATAHVPGPYEAFALADFTNTGRFSFEAYNAQTGDRILDAQFDIVPAPGGLSIALSIAVVAMRRRR